MKKLLIILLILQACTKDEPFVILGHDFEIDVRLPVDSNGYYYLELSEKWQTLHRISGEVSSIENDFDIAKVNWESSHHWYIGDTLGYIVHQNNTLNDTYFYITPDTNYITWFEGSEVPIINKTSYQTQDGEINTMFAPVKSMRDDTILVSAYPTFADGYIGNKLSISIILY